MRLDCSSGRRRLIVGIVSVLCVLAGAARAEVVRVAVGDFQLKSDGSQTPEDAEGMAVLWRSLLENGLSEFDSIEVLEREDIAAILKEAHLSLSSLADSESRLRVQKLLGADFLVLAEMNAGQKTCEVSVRLVSARESSVEGTFSIKVDAERIEEEAEKLAGEICKSALEAFAEKRIVDLVAVLDFENKSPLARNDWLETSMARRLRQKLRTLPGLRTLEREEVDLLLQEVRLGAGGFIEGETADAGTNGNSRRRFLVTGFYDEYQPLDKALHFEFTVLVQNIDSKKRNTRQFVFESDRLGKGVEGIVSFIEEQILGKESLSQQEQAKEPDIAQDPLSQALACLDDETAQALLALDKRCKDEPRLIHMRDTIVNNIIEQSRRRNQPGGSAYESIVNFEKALAELGVRSQDGLKKEIDLATGSQPALLPQYGKHWGMEKLHRFRRTDNDRTMWDFSYGGSYSIYNSGYMKKVARRATVQRAIRYLKAAVMLNGDNVLAKELLSALLSDRQIGNVELATEFAQEIAAGYPDTEHQKGALSFLINRYSTNVRLALPYLELMIEKYPGRGVLKSIRTLTSRLYWQNEVPLEERLRLSERFRGIVFSDSNVSDDEVFAQTRNWYRLTQSNEKYREFGENEVKRLVEEHPKLASAICYDWSWCWDRRHWDWIATQDYQPERNTKVIYWSRCGIELYSKRPPDTRNNGEWMLDALKYRLGLNLFEAEQYAEALKVFATLKGTKYARGVDCRLLEGVCLYQLGNYEEALARFEEMGTQSSLSLVRFRHSKLLQADADGKAVEWARRCRERLAIRETKTVSEANPVVDHWRQLETRLPISGRISVLGWDGEGIWMGTNLRDIADGWLGTLNEQAAARELRNYNERVVLARFNPATGEVQAFRGTQLSSPWISCILAYDGRVWVGTEGGGLNVYDPGNDTWSNISDKQGLPSNHVQCLAADGSYMWIGTGNEAEGDERRGAVARYDMESGRIHTFLSRDYPGQIAPPTWHVYDIEPTDKYVWFACLNLGIVRYDKQDNTWSNPLEDINRKVLRQEGEVKPGDFMRGIDNMAVFNNRLWFAHSNFTTPKASELQKIGYTLEDRSIFSCDLSGEDFQSLSLADGLPKAEISSLQATEDNLFLGTSGRQAVGSYIVPGPYGLLIMNKDGDFGVFEATEIFNRKPRSVGLKQILVLDNEVWASVGSKLKVLKYR